jgi:hypothetical protein
MAKFSKLLKFGGNTYRFKKIISPDEKELFEKHPHNGKYFLFRRSSRGNFRWYVRTKFGSL